MQMTWPGAPTIYYGDEAGVVGFTDPDNRRTYPWGHEDQNLLEFHRAAIRMHKANPVLRHGSLIFLSNDYNTLSYGRFSDQEQIIVAFNNNEEDRTMTIPVWRAGVKADSRLRRILYTDSEGFVEEGSMDYNVGQGEVSLTLPGMSAVVLKNS